jgi:ribonuclease HII
MVITFSRIPPAFFAIFNSTMHFCERMLQPFYQKRYIEAGCDEAGRGCYAGPVFAAAVILRKDFYHPVLNDSKQLTEAQRNELRPIIEKEAICYSVAKVDHDEIDRINILRASIKAMHLALDNLKKSPKYILVDGNRFTQYRDLKHKCVIKGDGLYSSIAAASVLAKTYRDEFMKNLHHEFPLYNWSSNKGYGTEEHRLAIEAHGLCKYHRLSFKINTHQLALDFDEENILM